MSKRKVPSLDRSKATTEGSLNSYHSVWMAHWKAAKPPPPPKSNFLSLNSETRESDSSSGQEVTSSPSHVPKMDRQICKVPVKTTLNVKAVATNTANIVDGTAVAMVSQNLGYEEPISVPSPVLGLPLPDNATSTPRNERASGCSYDEAWNALAMQSSSKNWIDGYVDGSKRRFASENFMEKKSIMVSTPFQESPLLPISRQVVASLNTDGNSLNHVSVNTPSLRNRALSLLKNDNPPTGQERTLTFLTEDCHEGFLGHHQAFLSQSSPLEVTKRETFCAENPSGQSHPVVDVKTTTTRTFVDSNEGLTAGQPKFSQTTHQLFYSEKNDTQLSKRGPSFRESTIYTNHEENGTFGQFLSLSMNGNYHGNPGIKLQQLGSLTDSEGHENPAKGRTSAVALKNKSSAETHTLDIDALPKKRLMGEASSFTKKEPSSGKGGGCMVKVDLCDKKRKFLTLATTSSSTENGEPSPSKTQSFGAEHLLPHEDPGSHSNPGARFGDQGGPEQRQPQMKQRQPQTQVSEPDPHLESLKMGDESPVGQVKDLFGRISSQMNVTSEPVGGDTLDAQLTGPESGHSVRLAKDGVSTSVDNTNAEKGRCALLSDPWIQRWCHNQAAALPEKKEPVVQYEPFGTKSFDERQKKQIPSVAAMALMGKAMNGFHPCEFKRRGSFIMWNS